MLTEIERWCTGIISAVFVSPAVSRSGGGGARGGGLKGSAVSLSDGNGENVGARHVS